MSTSNASIGAQIWRDEGAWTRVVDDGFGKASNWNVGGLATFGDHLYAGVSNWDAEANRSAGGEIWRSADGEEWEPVVTGGLDNEGQSLAFSLAVFSDTLFAGTWTYDPEQGAEIWASKSGNSVDWDRVAPNGLGNTEVAGIMTMDVFDHTLYAGTYNLSGGGEVWRSADGSSWERVASGGFGDPDNEGVWTLEPVAKTFMG